MKVYLVFCDNESYELYGIFKTNEIAKAHVEKYKFMNKNELFIEEWEVSEVSW